MMTALYEAFRRTDASLLEINPLIVTEDGDLLALDAKMTFDDNALFRHPDFKELRDPAKRIRSKSRRRSSRLNYIKLDGTIGCMVNGAGLAMATMDIIKLAGGEPANFLDVGGGANAEQIKNAFRILMSDKSVKAVLINIFGGILRCDVLAEGRHRGGQGPRRAACRSSSAWKAPTSRRASRCCKDSGLNFTTADDDERRRPTKVVAAGQNELTWLY